MRRQGNGSIVGWVGRIARSFENRNNVCIFETCWHYAMLKRKREDKGETLKHWFSAILDKICVDIIWAKCFVERESLADVSNL